MYYSYNIKKIKTYKTIDNTYTLSVKSDYHQFDSRGIISKNTSADIMKTVMAKTYAWIHRNNLQEDVKILITMHDELVFEVTTEKLELLVPELAKIMMLPEIINDKFHWPIPLTVDVKYGESWRVKKKFFEDFPEAKKRLNEPLIEFSFVPTPVVETKSKIIAEPAKQEPAPVINSMPDSTNQPEPIVQEKPKADSTSQEILDIDLSSIQSKVSSDSTSEPNIDVNKIANDDPVYVYTLRDTGSVTLIHLNHILDFLIRENKDSPDSYEGPKKILRVRDPQGNSLLVSEYKVPIDAFRALARLYKI
jgi:hypothetical protein